MSHFVIHKAEAFRLTFFFKLRNPLVKHPEKSGSFHSTTCVSAVKMHFLRTSPVKQKMFLVLIKNIN